ncbi:abnormal spindle-like microcephaly-associated protein [Hemitrygon akajei]|uniref:abnormal spindle-like microcephaly-associated protein n=1 Tax=Hemitrygon akajei TaxID=2704970 RepID=UPI003BFA0DA1
MDSLVRSPVAAGGPRRQPYRGPEEGDDVPVLTLTHFARTPFVCFKTVRTGYAKTERLAVENPESVPVLVTVDKFPSSKGFVVNEREFVIEPAGRYYLSITWAPVEAGRVRETVTFSVGCVKVLCILLGKAEDPPKKKRSLWESIKGKKASENTVRSKQKRNVSIGSKTIIIPQKKDFMKMGRSRPLSPLQPCENLRPVGKRVPPLHPVDALDYASFDIKHISPILPTSQIRELENCTPQSLKKFGSFSIHQGKAMPLHKDGRLEYEEKTDELCTSEVLKTGLNKTPLSFLCASALQTPVHKRQILSPDSFVNDSYVPDEDAESVVESAVLSPDQFLKDAKMSMNQPCSMSVEASSIENLKSGSSLSTESSPRFMSEHGSPVINVEELKPAKSRLTFFVFSKTTDLAENSQACGQEHQSTAHTKMLPVFTTTDNKDTSVGYSRLESKVKLSSYQSVEVNSRFRSRSIIDVETKAENRSPKLANRSTLPSRKRKSSEYLSNNACEKGVHTNKRKTKCVEQLSPKLNVVKKTTSRSLNGGGKRLQKRKSVSQLKISSVRVNNGKLMPGVAQSQLTFRKLMKTVIPRHPLPFAAKNMFYDERWKEKQERGFTWWLNFILTPDDLTVNTESSRVNTATLFIGSEIQHHKISVSSAPTKEEMSLRAYTAKCRLNRLRRAACRLFTSESMVKVIQKLEAAIEAKHLLVRKDRCLWKDFGHRQKILKWLLSYNPLWLRIGLECVFGEMIPLESNSDVNGLARFILNRLLWNSDIAAVYRHSTVPHLYADEHQEVLAQFTLKKFLLLVWFLDCAKQSRMIDHDPCLFCKDAEFKASKDLLLAFSRDFLSGEGDICRHLGFLGLTVSHCQMPLHEFNFAVTNLAVDLRCGIRLVRAVELLTQDWKLSKQLRVPAISRLQKLHNVDVALKALKTRVDLKDERGIDIDPRDIVDGHREKTLALLWRIIFAFQVEILLNEDQLREEIEFLKNNLHTSHKLAALRSLSVPPHPVKDKDLNCLTEKYSPQITLLMNWINAVCAYYGVKVENFTVPFSDGRVLCYLIHHYHPSLLPVNNICQRTTQTVEYAQHGTVAIDTSTSESDENSIDAIPTNTLPLTGIYEELLENEKKNFNLVTTAVAELGGIPAMIRLMDMSNTIPEEKVVITYVSFLCARLLDLRKEARAARIIQAAWRRYKLNCELQLLKEKEQAASVLQTAVRKFLHRQQVKKKNKAAMVIQSTWRGHVARQKTKALIMFKIQAVQNEAATLLQACWRGYVDRRHFQRLRQYCILMQSRIRMKTAVTSYNRVKWATVTIQRHFRAHQLCVSEQRNYLKLKTAVDKIQSGFRRWRAHKMEKQTKAAIVLQKYVRGFLSRGKYKRFQRSVLLIQAHAKGFLIRTEMRRRKNAAVTLKKYIKAYVRGKREYDSYQRLKWAAVVIQRAYRHLKTQKLCHLTKSATLIQSTFRMYKQRTRFVASRKAAITMQSLVRMHQARARFLQCRHAAVIIQRHFRAKQQGRNDLRHFLKLRQAALKLQVSFRKRQAQKVVRKNQAAITIQSWYRMHRGKQKYLRAKRSCIRIQSWYRCYVAQNAFCSQKSAALAIQKYYRAYRESKAQHGKYKLMLKAAVIIQAYFRGMNSRQLARKMKAARVIQSYWKMRKERLKFLYYKQCIIVLQAHVRRSYAQKRYHSMKVAIYTLQAHFRAILAQKKAQAEYRAVRAAAIALQSAYRRLQMRRQAYLLQSVVRIQSAFRAYVSRKKYLQIRSAAVKIQASVKMIQARKYYTSLKKAAVCIQRRYRANRLCLEKRKEYLRKKEACIYLQSAIRQHLAQKQLRLCRQAAIKIQSMFRMYRVRSQYQRIRCAAVVIQRGFRVYQEGTRQRQNFLKTREAVIRLQAAYKGYSVRRKMKLQHRAASKIQAAFRGHASRVKYSSMKNAAITVQNWYRNCKVGQQQRLRYLNIKASVVILQAAFRGLSARKKLEAQQKAAVTIQTAFRRCRAQYRFGVLKRAVITVQCHFRAKLLGRKERCAYLRIRRSAIALQAAYKGKIARKELGRKRKACIVIQSYFRMHKTCIEFQTKRRAALIIQQYFRAHIQRKYQYQKYQNLRAAVVVLQAAFRAMKTRKRLKEMHKAATIIQRSTKSFLTKKHYTALKAASVVVQRQFRAFLLSREQREMYLSIRRAAITIQAAYRGMKVRREIRHKHKAATVIQAAFRMHRVYLPYRAMRLAATIIQSHYRAHLQRKTDRNNYLKIRSSILLLQAAYRGMNIRRCLWNMNKSARIIQSYYRMHKQYQCFQKLRRAAIVIQQRYRACQIRDAHVRQYKAMKRAAVCLQAAFRRMKTRQQMRQVHLAATIIQRRFRSYVARKNYLLLRAAASVIQVRYRALVLARNKKQAYASIRKATISIQAAYRGMKVRREIRHKHKAATVIQAAFRMHRVYLPYRAMRLAATIIQSHYRAHLQRETDRNNYLKIRNSVVLLQAAYRGMNVRRCLRNMNKSARIIQSYYRMHKQYQYFQKLRQAAIVIQQRYQACQIRDAHVRQYKAMKRAAACLQAAFRRMKTRQQMRRVHLAATIIQRRFRSYVARKNYLLLRAAASVIQVRYRALVLARNKKQAYASIRKATISIQAAYRGMKVRREIQHKHKAATVIQAAFKMHRVYLPYRAMRLAATIIQSHYRAHLQRKTDRNNYLKIHSSVLVIQAAFRGMIVRRHLRKMHKSARTVQTYYRMHKQHQCFKKLQWATTAIQRRYRACQIRDIHVRQYNTLRKAAVCIQAFYRGKKARDLVKTMKAAIYIKSYLLMCTTRKRFLIQKTAVVTLQASFRGYRARVRYRAMRLSTILIQRWYRACKLGRSQFVQYQSMRNAAIVIQAAYKGMVVRQCVKQQYAAVKIQSLFRMIHYRRRFLKLKCGAIVLQSHYRAYEARKQYRAYVQAAVILQRQYRSYLLMKKERNAYLTFRQTVIRLQARIRGFIVQRNYERLHQSITKIQACYRGKKQRQAFLLYKESALVIQQHYRAYCQRRIEQEKYFKMKHAAVTIQTSFRRYQERQVIRKTKAAQKIQAWFKGQVVHRRYKAFLASVIFIQRHFRAKQDRSRFLKIQVATIVIQRRWRMAIEARKLEHTNRRRAMGAIKIQAFWKGFKVRKQMTKKHEAASRIQLAFRAYTQREKFLQQRRAAVLIQRQYRAWHLAKVESLKYNKTRKSVIHLQSLCRGWLVRKKLAEKKRSERNLRFAAAAYHNLCAVKIQKAYWGYLALKHAKEKINSVIYIQRWFRTCLQRRRYLYERGKIIAAQRIVKAWYMRRHKAAVVIQESVRKFLYKIRSKKIHNGIIKIQALWKGYWLRKKIRNPQIIAIRHRIQRANKNSYEDQKLCNRTAVAVDYILKYKHFSYILAALQHLEVATRLSAICCENLAQSGATPIIFTLIRSCNRSVPCMDVIKSAIQVLLNLSKYEKTASVVYEVENSIDTLLELLYTYRGKAGDKTSDKCGSIFSKVCCLLAILSQDSKNAFEVRSLPKAVDRIRNVYKLTARKHKMDADRINVKQRMQTPLNGSLYIPATPVRTRAVSKLKPDWVLRRDNVKEVVDPLKAIQLVMDTLGISL